MDFIIEDDIDDDDNGEGYDDDDSEGRLFPGVS